ncbi:MAG: hypothetical protein MJ192_01720 [Clostridia bacterium]|nr:hypothetical protein [Clostridia bacterium]
MLKLQKVTRFIPFFGAVIGIICTVMFLCVSSRPIKQKIKQALWIFMPYFVIVWIYNIVIKYILCQKVHLINEQSCTAIGVICILTAGLVLGFTAYAVQKKDAERDSSI